MIRQLLLLTFLLGLANHGYSLGVVQTKLLGTWSVQKECGGFSGGCWTTGFEHTTMVVSALGTEPDSLKITYLRKDTVLGTLRYQGDLRHLPGAYGGVKLIVSSTDSTLVLSDDSPDGVATDYKKVTLSREQLMSVQLSNSFFPNPVSSVLNINSYYKKMSLSFFSVDGKLVCEIGDVDGKTSLDLAKYGLQSGHYLMKVTADKVQFHRMITVK